MNPATATQRDTAQVSGENAIRPFKVDVPEAGLAQLRKRIHATKWPQRVTVTDAPQGVQLATMQALARYLARDYDWRKIEVKPNELHQFLTEDHRALTNPTANGGNASDAFDVVIPSMLGYCFSGKPTATGWASHIEPAWTARMKRLGYTKFVTQGGGWRAIITELMGVQALPELQAFIPTCRT